MDRESTRVDRNNAVALNVYHVEGRRLCIQIICQYHVERMRRGDLSCRCECKVCIPSLHLSLENTQDRSHPQKRVERGHVYRMELHVSLASSSEGHTQAYTGIHRAQASSVVCKSCVPHPNLSPQRHRQIAHEAGDSSSRTPFDRKPSQVSQPRSEFVKESVCRLQGQSDTVASCQQKASGIMKNQEGTQRPEELGMGNSYSIKAFKSRYGTTFLFFSRVFLVLIPSPLHTFRFQIPILFSSQCFSGFVFWCSPWLNKRVTRPSLDGERKGRKRRLCQKTVVDGDSPYQHELSWE